MIVLLGQVEEGAGHHGVVMYKLMVEVGKAKKGAHVLDSGWGWPSSNTVELDRVHGKLTRFHNHSEIFNF